MFEKSLLPFGNNRDRRRTRWIVAVSLSAQVVALALMVVMPLLYPARMPPFRMARQRTVELIRQRRPTPPKPLPVQSRAVSAMRTFSTAPAMHTSAPQLVRMSGPALAEPALLTYGRGGMSDPNTGNLLTGFSSTENSVSVRPSRNSGTATAGPVRLSMGVTSGMLLSPIRPEYPQIAKVTRTEGTVVVTARIDTQGRIVGLQVVSGPPMLRTAAEDAVREARYKPYLLNGQPTEVETTISVSFHIGG